jgi:hypothetical protein
VLHLIKEKEKSLEKMRKENNSGSMLKIKMYSKEVGGSTGEININVKRHKSE